MKFFIGGLFIYASAVSGVFAEASSSSTNVVPLTSALISQLAEEARTNSPALKSAEARLEAARANEQSARTWEDPIIHFGVNPASRSFRASDGDLLYGVEQSLPLWGKPKAARDVAAVEIKLAKANANERFQELRKEIAQNLFRAAVAHRALEIQREDLAWLDTMVEVTEQRYEVGSATQLDVLRLENERSKRAAQLRTDEQMLEHEQVNLNRLLNRKFHSPWPLLQLPPIAPPIVDEEKLRNLALKNEPKLRAMQQEIDQAAATANKTRRDRYPNFNLGAEARNYSGSGEFRQGTLTFSFNVPWGNREKYFAAIKRDEAKKNAIELDAADYELAIANQLHDLILKIDAARREALLYHEQILPRSQTAVASARSAWESSAGLFRDVLDAHRMLLEAQLLSARAIAEQHQILADLVFLCGVNDSDELSKSTGQNFQLKK